MNVAYEPLPTTGHSELDRKINAVNKLIVSHAATMSRGTASGQITSEILDAALDGKFGQAMQESAESFVSKKDDFDTKVETVRERINDGVKSLQRNKEIKDFFDRNSERYEELSQRLDDIAEMLEG